MLHPRCVNRGHNWDNWRWAPSMPDGSRCDLFGDTYTAEGKHYRYRRECQNLGCDAVELADKLVAAGSHTILDVGGSEALYRKIDK